MRIPNLSRIVEAHILITIPGDVVEQIRKDALPSIRKLEMERKLPWCSLLLHHMYHLEDSDPQDKTPIIHLRLEPASDLSVDDFMTMLPSHFLNPHPVTLGAISGVDEKCLRDNDWAFAWAVLGSATGFVLDLIEAHTQPLPPSQTIQFLHYITNALTLGNQSIFAPNRQTF